MAEPKIPSGYILLSRKIIESKIWDKPPLYIKVWIYLLSRAQYKQYKQLQKGQLVTSIPEIIKACSWLVGYRREYPTKDQIYQIIEWLRNPDETHNESNTKATMIATTRATHKLLVTICNYSYYQESDNYEGNDDSNDEKATNPLREQRPPNNINKKDKNYKNNNTNNKGDYVNLKDVLDYFNEKCGKIQNTGKETGTAKRLAEMGIPYSIFVQGIDESFEAYYKEHDEPGDTIKSFCYCEGRIKSLWQQEQAKGVSVKRGADKQRPNNKELGTVHDPGEYLSE